MLLTRTKFLHKLQVFGRRILRNLLVVGVLFSTFILVAYTLFATPPIKDFPLIADLQYWRGYPWLPAILLSIGLVSISAVAGSSNQLTEWANDDAVPRFWRFMLKILLLADAEPIHPRVWWLLVVITLASLAGTWRFPQCISSEDVLIVLRIMRRNSEITSLSPSEMVGIEPDVTVRLQAEIDPVSNGMELPVLDCKWEDAGVGSDGHLLNNKGCRVEYQTGQDETPDGISMQLVQQRCSPLGSYPFFVESKP
jgi:hypothetical protein